MSKRTLIAAPLIVLSMISSGFAGSSVGSSFGTLTTAEAIGQGRANFSAGVGLADGTSLFGSITYGLAKYTDGRIRIGLTDRGPGDTKISIGADFKWQFWNVGPETDHPFDFAVGGLLEFTDFDRGSVLQVGGQLIGSYPVKLSSGSVITPYGRFNTRIEALSDINNGQAADNSETNLEIGISGGVKWQITSGVGLFGEFQIDGNDGLFFGIDFNVQ